MHLRPMAGYTRILKTPCSHLLLVLVIARDYVTISGRMKQTLLQYLFRLSLVTRAMGRISGVRACIPATLCRLRTRATARRLLPMIRQILLPMERLRLNEVEKSKSKSAAKRATSVRFSKRKGLKSVFFSIVLISFNIVLATKRIKII